VREPAFTIEWTGIFVFTPIRAFRWISLDCTCQLYSLSYARGRGNVTLHIVYHTKSFLGLPGGALFSVQKYEERAWFVDWCGCRGRRLADTLHGAMECLAAEVKHDGIDGTVETIGTLGQGGQYPLLRFTTDSMGVWNTLTMVA